MTHLAVFAYGSLVSPASAALSLDRPVELAAIARVAGWRRRWTTCRDNLAAEKTFALADGVLPPFILGLNIEPDPGSPGANGALIEITEAEAERLDLRELRYDRSDVTADVRVDGDVPGSSPFDRVIAYAAKPGHHAPEPPAGRCRHGSLRGGGRGRVRRAGPGAAPAVPRDDRSAPGRTGRRDAGRGRDPAGKPARVVSG